ncbi:AMP-binding protein [Oculatella sp. LEGE 06141]|uniref:AMP-dependent synthetase/ligase n=1 Tax=Oculatella sp. LEGE 06141 TaxID=1828648 RepID=UPI0018811516|nr:AMP-binding protein [Oculatella sp. LEGE 06141]MBE9179576.1 AMP-binding protein [Oculatella sp. LEGE 06141]
MLHVKKIHQAPLNSGEMFLGRTLPSLLDEACDRTQNDRAFHQWTETGWQTLSNQAFQTAVEATALGLLAIGLEKGDRAALLMHSDLNFCIADMGCLFAHLIDVPIDLTQTLEHIIFVLKHSEAKALIVSNLDLLTQITPYIGDSPDLHHIIVINVPADWRQTHVPEAAVSQSQRLVSPLHSTGQEPSYSEAIPESACLDIPMVLHPAHAEPFQSHVPQCVQVFSLKEIQTKGESQRSDTRLQHLRTSLAPSQLATIIYIPDPNGQLEGVMLTHENLSANALTAFSGLPDLQRGSQDAVLSFLPLNHVLARCLLYGHINYGHSIYFSTPNRVMKHLQDVQPTILVTVPLLVEKVYSKILEKGNKPSPSLSFSAPVVAGLLFPRSLFQLPQIALTHMVFQWALKLAKQYELGRQPKGLYALRLKVADWLVLSKWRAVFGGRLKYLICGGAALNAELANVFAAAGVTILQGYGLTQASAVVACNRGRFNRAGTVGVPIAGVEVAIAADDEILVRGPYITPGYYKNPEATREAIDQQGWFHTGDLGAFTADGFLKITGLKKALFKLSTGKYIVPQPIEARLKQSSFVSQAIAVGSERKFCALLIIPNMSALHTYALGIGLDLPNEALLKHPCIIALYQSLVTAANCRLPYWATVKRFRLLDAPFTVDNGLLISNHQINRANVLKTFANEIDALYQDAGTRRVGESRETNLGADHPVSSVSSAVICPPTPESSCPAFAQSLNPRLTN